jgi:hypothetical protein
MGEFCTRKRDCKVEQYPVEKGRPGRIRYPFGALTCDQTVRGFLPVGIQFVLWFWNEFYGSLRVYRALFPTKNDEHLGEGGTQALVYD